MRRVGQRPQGGAASAGCATGARGLRGGHDEFVTRRWIFADQLGRHFFDHADQPALLIESRACFRAPAVPPAEGAPRAVRDAPPRRRTRRPAALRPCRHLRRGTRCRRRAAVGVPPDVAPRAGLRDRPRRGRGAARARVRDVDRAVRRMGRRAGRQAVAAGGLLPRRPAAAGRADGRRRTRRRQVELRRRQPRTAAETLDARRRRTVVAGRGRDRRAGPPRPGRVGRRRGRVPRRGRPAPLRRHPPRGAARAARLRRAPAAGLRRARGRDAVRRCVDGALAAVGTDEPRPAGPRRGRAPRRAGLPRRRRADRRGRGVRAAGDRLARLRLAPVLAAALGPTAAATNSARRRSCRSGSPNWTTSTSTPPACPASCTTLHDTAGCTTSRG